MYLQISVSSGVPVYRQIVNQVKYNIASALLAPGEQLPSIRDLAVQLHVNPNTIAKAYADLERQRVVQTRKGLGTFVSDDVQKITKVERRRIATEMMDQLLVELPQLDLTREEIQKIFESRVGKFAYKEMKDPGIRKERK